MGNPFMDIVMSGAPGTTAPRSDKPNPFMDIVDAPVSGGSADAESDEPGILKKAWDAANGLLGAGVGGVKTATSLAAGAVQGDPLKYLKINPDEYNRALSTDTAARTGVGQLDGEITGRDLAGAVGVGTPQAEGKSLYGIGKQTLLENSEAARALVADHPYAEKVVDFGGELASGIVEDPVLHGMGALGRTAGRGALAAAEIEAAGSGLRALTPEMLAAAERAVQAGTTAAGRERALGAAFIPGMAQGAVQGGRAAYDRYQHEGFTPETLGEGLDAASAAIFAGMGGMHALSAHPAVHFEGPVAPGSPDNLSTSPEEASAILARRQGGAENDDALERQRQYLRTGQPISTDNLSTSPEDASAILARRYGAAAGSPDDLSTSPEEASAILARRYGGGSAAPPISLPDIQTKGPYQPAMLWLQGLPADELPQELKRFEDSGDEMLAALTRREIGSREAASTSMATFLARAKTLDALLAQGMPADRNTAARVEAERQALAQEAQQRAATDQAADLQRQKQARTNAIMGPVVTDLLRRRVEPSSAIDTRPAQDVATMNALRQDAADKALLDRVQRQKALEASTGTLADFDRSQAGQEPGASAADAGMADGRRPEPPPEGFGPGELGGALDEADASRPAWKQLTPYEQTSYATTWGPRFNPRDTARMTVEQLQKHIEPMMRMDVERLGWPREQVKGMSYDLVREIATRKERPPKPAAPEAPRYAYRARDVGEQGVPDANHAQATTSEADARRLAPSRSDTPQEVVRVDLSKLHPKDYEVMPGPHGSPWVKFKRPLEEHHVEHVGPLTEADRMAADKAEPPVRAAVAAAPPTVLAREAGLTPQQAEKGQEDVRKDSFHEFSPEAVAVKKAVIEGAPGHEMPEAGRRLLSEVDHSAPGEHPGPRSGYAYGSEQPRPPANEIDGRGTEAGADPNFAARMAETKRRAAAAQAPPPSRLSEGRPPEGAAADHPWNGVEPGRPADLPRRTPTVVGRERAPAEGNHPKILDSSTAAGGVAEGARDLPPAEVAPAAPAEVASADDVNRAISTLRARSGGLQSMRLDQVAEEMGGVSPEVLGKALRDGGFVVTPYDSPRDVAPDRRAWSRRLADAMGGSEWAEPRTPGYVFAKEGGPEVAEPAAAKPDKARLIPTRGPDGGVQWTTDPETGAMRRVPTETRGAAPPADVSSDQQEGSDAGRGDGRGRPEPAPRGEDPRSLEEAPAEDVRGPEAAGDAGTDPSGHGEAVGGNTAGPDARAAEDVVRPGGRDQPAGVAASGRGAAAEPGPRPEDVQLKGTDHRITDEDRIGEGSTHQKATDNLEAIKLLKQIEGEGRAATPEEQAQLARYVGWGGLADAFNPYGPKQLAAIAKALGEHLTPEELASAKASTPNAHYTSPPVIKAMWDAVKRLGLGEGARVLEPSMGVGHFFGLMPEDLRAGSKRVGVEIDSLTGRIAKLLYPEASVHVNGFERVRMPDNFFDLAISNVPFGNYGIHDPKYKGTPAVTRSIHDYFFAKGLDKVRPGGVVAFITSSHTMDKSNTAVRKYLAERADLVGAIRLPNTAFKGNAGTEVTTDVIFLRKRAPGEAPGGEAWTERKGIKGKDGTDIDVNEYFAAHPEMMLGEMSLKGSMYRADEPTLEGKLTPELLDGAISRLPENVFKPLDETAATENPATTALPQDSTLKEGAYGIGEDGTLVRRQGDSLVPAKLSAPVAERVKGMVGVRDAVRDVLRTQLSDSAEEDVAAARARLNKVYDAFVKKHGALSDPKNTRKFAGDPDAPLLLSLENYDADTKTAKKADVFSKRTIERYTPVQSVGSPHEALTVSLNERGRLDWDRMQELTGKSPTQLQKELGDLVYQNPDGHSWETTDDYLSGNVRDKLAAAEAAAAADPKFKRNVEALQRVQPVDLTPGDIDARLGAGWVPKEDVRDFVADLLGVSPRNVKLSHSGVVAAWSLEVERHAQGTVENTVKWGTQRVGAHELIDAALNLRMPTVRDRVPGTKDSIINQAETTAAREKQQMIRDEFRKWLWKDPARAERLSRKYNDEFNNLRLREYDGAHLTLPGMARGTLRGGDLDPHQKNAIWRILQNGNTLLAHVVGAGKTFEMTGAAMEMRRMGLSKKPMFVVPNHLVEQWGASILRLYPDAKVLVAGKEHFAKGKRQEVMSRIATGNYDAVIVAHSSFEKLPVGDDTFNKHLQAQIAALEQHLEEVAGEKGKSDRNIRKELEKAKKRLEAKIRKKANVEAKDQTLTFEELGVDSLFVDEAHYFKNLFFPTKMTRVAGLPATESNRAFDMYIKTQHVADMNGGTHGVVFATGTPISNSMAEMYTMQRYLQGKHLEESGLANFDAWAQQYGETVTSLEIAPDGAGYRSRTRFAKFTNIPELVSSFRQTADVQTADMLKLPRPEIEGGKPGTVVAPGSAMLKDYVQTLVKRADAIRQGKVQPEEDNMLKVTGDGRKAALDMRIVDSMAPDDPDSKVNQAARRIKDIWKKTSKQKSTQLVFSDLSTPAAKGKKKAGGSFTIYDDLRAKLIRAGIPDKEIAFIHDAKTDAAKTSLFNKVNSGKVRVLIGSTDKMGAGTNVQQRLVALHHLDAPWRPSDIEQREGRILRQGNENKKVGIHRYVTEGSFDAYMWQTLETKARFIEQVMRGDVSVRNAEDIEGGSLTFAEIKALASGNPMVFEKVKIDAELRKLDQLRAHHLNAQVQMRQEMATLPTRIGQAKDAGRALQADINTRDAAKGEFAMTVGKQKFEGKGAREKAAAALDKAIREREGAPDTKPVKVGELHGFDVLAQGRAETAGVGLYLDGEARHIANVSPDSPVGTVASLESSLRGLEGRASANRDTVARMEKKLEGMKAESGKPFDHEQRLAELVDQQQKINKALDLDKGDAQAAEEGGPDEAGGDEEPQMMAREDAPPQPAEAKGRFDMKAAQERAKAAEENPDQLHRSGAFSVAATTPEMHEAAKTLAQHGRHVMAAMDRATRLIGRSARIADAKLSGFTTDGASDGYMLPKQKTVRLNPIAHYIDAVAHVEKFKPGLTKAIERADTPRARAAARTAHADAVAQEMARRATRTLVHELAHFDVTGHGDGHVQEQVRIMAAIAGRVREAREMMRAAIMKSGANGERFLDSVVGLVPDARDHWRNLPSDQGKAVRGPDRDVRGSGRAMPVEAGDRGGQARADVGEGGRPQSEGDLRSGGGRGAGEVRPAGDVGSGEPERGAAAGGVATARQSANGRWEVVQDGNAVRTNLDRATANSDARYLNEKSAAATRPAARAIADVERALESHPIAKTLTDVVAQVGKAIGDRSLRLSKLYADGDYMGEIEDGGITLNPLVPFESALRHGDSEVPGRVAKDLWGTIVHEAAHKLAGTDHVDLHGGEHSAAERQVEAALAAQADTLKAAIESAVRANSDSMRALFARAQTAWRADGTGGRIDTDNVDEPQFASRAIPSEPDEEGPTLDKRRIRSASKAFARGDGEPDGQPGGEPDISLNLNRVKIPEERKERLAEFYRVLNPGLDRSEVKHWDDIEPDMRVALEHSPESLADRGTKRILDQAELKALRIFEIEESSKLDDALAAKVKATGTSDERSAEDAYWQQSLKAARIGEALGNQKTEVARLLQSLGQSVEGGYNDEEWQAKRAIKATVLDAVDNDFMGLIQRMKDAGELREDCT